MSAAFDAFGFDNNEEWKSYLSSLYIPTNNQSDYDKIVLKRKRKWFKQNIDDTYEWEEEDKKQPEQTKTEESNSNRRSTPPPSSPSPSSSSSSFSG